MVTPNLGKHSGVIRMEEAKKIFPGHTISHVLSLFSTFVLVGIISIFFGGDVFDIANYLPRIEFFENDGKYLLVVALATIATLSFQHKAVFTKKTDDDKVHFWKQITPYFIYGRREFDVKDLSYWVKKRKKRHYHDDHHSGHRSHTRTTTTHTVFLYESEKKFLVIRPKLIPFIRKDNPADYFREILGKGPRRGHKERDWLFDLIYYIID